MKLRKIASLVNATCEGDDSIEIRGVAKIDEASQGEITFIANQKYAKFISETKASAIIVGRKFSAPSDIINPPALLRVDDPYVSFLKVLVSFHPPEDPLPPGVHPTAVISPEANIANDARIGAHVVIESKSTVAGGAQIAHGSVIGRGVSIGENSILYPNVTVREGCLIGARVVVHSGTTIGSDGFGFAPQKDGTFEKIPQVGIVVIEDDVEIGANCAIDRATMGETRIKKGAKLDNLIQVAHNVVIGENTVIAAQAGISGSTRIGAGAMIGGQVGITGHLEIADRTRIGAQSGVHKSISEPGQTYFGFPATPHREAMRLHGAIVQLPEMRATIKKMEKAIEELLDQVKGRKE